MTRPRRLLAVGHSYAVALNRRLPHEIAKVGAGRWEVTAAAPAFVHGDLRPIPLERFEGEACRLVPVPLHFSYRPHVMLYGRALRRLLRDPWDMVHCWEEPFVLCGAQAARWARPARLVYYTFQNIPKQYPPPFRWVERHSLRCAAGWVAAGVTVEDALVRRRGYAEKPHCVIPLGVDTRAFQPDPAARRAVRHRLGWPDPGPPIVGYLGRFIPEKGLAVLTAALEAVKAPWRALFVGGGALESELREWAARLPDDCVRVVTGVSHDRVPSYLCAMDVLAAPSQTTLRWKEQLGRMLIEAMACGVPVVGSDSGEIPTVVGNAGEVVAEADVSAWTRVLGGLVDTPTRRAELGALGRERAESGFDWPVVARAHIEFLDQLLDESTGG